MPELTQEFTTLPVDALEPHPDNPRRGDVDAIAESIDHNGFYGAIIAQRREDGSHRIIAGEHRWRGAQKQGMAEVPVMVLAVDDDAALRIMLADNRTTDLAGYDEEALARVLNDLTGGAEDSLWGTGFTDRALADLLHLATSPESLAQTSESVESLLGEMEEAAWPVLRIPCPPDTLDRFREVEGDDDLDRLRNLLAD